MDKDYQGDIFLQGTVESIALKDPKERTKMLECISQSRECAAEYNAKKAALLKAKEDTQFHFNKKKSATVEKKQVSQEKLEVRDHLHYCSYPVNSSETLAIFLLVSYFLACKYVQSKCLAPTHCYGL